MVAFFLLTGCGKSDAQAVQEPASGFAAAGVSGTAGMTQLIARPGGWMRIEGGSGGINGRWRIESHIIAGYLNVGAGFPIEPRQTAVPGKLEAIAEVVVPVVLLKMVDEHGTPRSDEADGLMHDLLKANAWPKIKYRLTDLVLSSGQTKNPPYWFDVKGDLMVAGVTNAIAMQVQIFPLGSNRLKIVGEASVKMTDFNITPPAAFNGMIKTYNEVKLSFEWIVAPKDAPSAPASVKRS